MDVIPIDGMNHPAEVLAHAAEMRVDCRSCGYSLESVRKGSKMFGKASGLVQIRCDQNTTYFMIEAPAKLLGLPNPAPPPKIHYSTWWRSIVRRIYWANASSHLKSLQASVQRDAPSSQD